MFKPELGVSLHTLSTSIDGKLIEAVKASKIKTLELFQRIFLKNPEEAKSLIRKLSASGIKITSIHADFWGGVDISSSDAGIRKKSVNSAFCAIELAEEFGADIVVLHSSIEPIAPEERDILKENAKDSINKIAEKCAEKGKRLAIELLPRTCLGNNTEELIELANGLPEATVGFCLDTNHLMDKPFTLADTVKIFGKRLFSTHLSDYDGVDERHQLPGTGVLDWNAFMKALNQIKYAGPFNFECAFHNNETPAECVAMLEESYDKLLRDFKHARG
ncbi:MAG: hypothetical protein A2020_02025 [Lentisphaerae bacterium GWF2_45_14]|nr:MAG: hypothetical protein A2020_02025 [Lentisphaerae bacterium GWF2_45_14]